MQLAKFRCVCVHHLEAHARHLMPNELTKFDHHYDIYDDYEFAVKKSSIRIYNVTKQKETKTFCELLRGRFTRLTCLSAVLLDSTTRG